MKRTATRKILTFTGTVISVLQMGAQVDAAEVSVCSLAANPKAYDHQNLSLQGTVTRLMETTSRQRREYTVFNLQTPGPCEVKVFIWQHHGLQNGEHVCVAGIFETEVHQGRYTFLTRFRQIQSDRAAIRMNAPKDELGPHLVSTTSIDVLPRLITALFGPSRRDRCVDQSPQMLRPGDSSLGALLFE